MLSLVPKATTTLTGSTKKTNCCDADVEIVAANNELLVRCEKCYKYIGNIVDREIALVESRYGSFIQKALDDKKMSLAKPEESLKGMYGVYRNYVLKFAEQAARTTLRDFLLTQDT